MLKDPQVLQGILALRDLPAPPAAQDLKAQPVRLAIRGPRELLALKAPQEVQVLQVRQGHKVPQGQPEAARQARPGLQALRDQQDLLVRV